VVEVTLYLGDMLQLTLLLTDSHKGPEKTEFMFLVQSLHLVDPTPAQEVVKGSERPEEGKAGTRE
jgi:hypothetical protein